MEEVVHVLEYPDGLEGAPDEAAAEEGGEQDYAVVPLELAAGHVEFVAEPVHVEEGGGEFVEDEDGAVVVYEGALCGVLEGGEMASWCGGRQGERHTKPKAKTERALTAWNHIPRPNTLMFRVLAIRSQMK